MSDRNQQQDWIKQVLDQYEGRLIRYAARITGSVDSARDVVQDTFLRLVKVPRKQVEQRLSEWLFTVCRNRAFDVRRRARKIRSISETEVEFSVASVPNPAQTAQKVEDAGRVMKALSELPGSQREVIMLKLQEGLSYKQISAVTKLTVSNVGYLIHVGISTIRQKLAAEEKEPQKAGNAS